MTLFRIPYIYNTGIIMKEAILKIDEDDFIFQKIYSVSHGLVKVKITPLTKTYILLLPKIILPFPFIAIANSSIHIKLERKRIKYPIEISLVGYKIIRR